MNCPVHAPRYTPELQTFHTVTRSLKHGNMLCPCRLNSPLLVACTRGLLLVACSRDLLVVACTRGPFTSSAACCQHQRLLTLYQ